MIELQVFDILVLLLWGWWLMHGFTREKMQYPRMPASAKIPQCGSRMKRSAMLRSSSRIVNHNPEQQVKQKMAA
ncbi:MAG: hypothetical protein Q8M95_14500 [Candidatus Methanoperedens sp.]|nr:hypothetical protein [Candidatus Methanoperedens sp.]